MKEINDIGKYSDNDWNELASILSDGKQDERNLLGRFMAEDSHNTIKYWKELREMNTEKEINVDKAWDKLYSRLNKDRLIAAEPSVKIRSISSIWLRIAAAALILTGIGAAVLYLGNQGLFSRTTVVATSENQKNLQITLPDGSTVSMNRNTSLSYRANFGKNDRYISLTGEAFFDILPDPENPFIVDAGMASIRVTGTSFNVLTSNSESAVEVYVQTGRVLLSGNKYDRSLEIDPGFIGTMSEVTAGKKPNNDPNYMSWNTGLLVYDGQTLDVVFRDLKRVYNMEIVADDPEILENQWTSPIINQPQETIIRLICTSFGLEYKKDGNVYHLFRK